MIARDQTGGIFSRTVFNLGESADRWNQFMLYYMLYYIVPQGAKQVSMLVIVKNQERGARFYIDDFFIRKYPNCQAAGSRGETTPLREWDEW